MFAVCCHHQCSWQETVGRPWLEREAGLTAREFAIVTRLSSWATCGFTSRQTDDSHSENGTVDHSNEQPPKTVGNAAQSSPFATYVLWTVFLCGVFNNGNQNSVILPHSALYIWLIFTNPNMSLNCYVIYSGLSLHYKFGAHCVIWVWMHIVGT